MWQPASLTEESRETVRRLRLMISSSGKADNPIRGPGWLASATATEGMFQHTAPFWVALPGLVATFVASRFSDEGQWDQTGSPLDVVCHDGRLDGRSGIPSLEGEPSAGAAECRRPVAHPGASLAGNDSAEASSTTSKSVSPFRFACGLSCMVLPPRGDGDGYSWIRARPVAAGPARRDPPCSVRPRQVRRPCKPRPLKES